MRVDLPGGRWAELLDPARVPERRRRAYLAAIAECANHGTVDAQGMELADRMGDLLIVCLVQAWSFGDVTVDRIQDFDKETFDTLFAACRPLSDELLPDYSPDVDPKVLTGGFTQQPTVPSTAATSATLSSATTSSQLSSINS